MSSPKIKLTPLSKLFSNLKADLKAVSDESRVNVENCVLSHHESSVLAALVQLWFHYALHPSLIELVF